MISTARANDSIGISSAPGKPFPVVQLLEGIPQQLRVIGEVVARGDGVGDEEAREAPVGAARKARLVVTLQAGGRVRGIAQHIETKLLDLAFAVSRLKCSQVAYPNSGTDCDPTAIDG